MYISIYYICTSLFRFILEPIQLSNQKAHAYVDHTLLTEEIGKGRGVKRVPQVDFKSALDVEVHLNK
jgi:hypothetical protein